MIEISGLLHLVVSEGVATHEVVAGVNAVVVQEHGAASFSEDLR